MNFSFVMTYNNRPEQLKNTLRSLSPCIRPDDQLIIVDDASQPDLSARVALSGVNLPVVLAEISPERKHTIGGVAAYNLGFSLVTKEAVIIMNAECIPIGSVIQNLRDQVSSTKYVVASCYASTEQQFRRICQDPDHADEITCPRVLEQWYHHPIHHPVWYHFTSAITTENLRRIGGFDRRFERGYCFDDNVFVLQILWNHLQICGTGDLHVIHQWHPKNLKFSGGCAEWERNRKLWIDIKEGRLPVWSDIKDQHEKISPGY